MSIKRNVSYVALVGQILSTNRELWYLDGILIEKARGCVESVTGQVLSKWELCNLDGEEILTKKLRVYVESVTEDVSFLTLVYAVWYGLEERHIQNGIAIPSKKIR
jgi:hypothetical protein